MTIHSVLDKNEILMYLRNWLKIYLTIRSSYWNWVRTMVLWLMTVIMYFVGVEMIMDSWVLIVQEIHIQ